DGLLSQGFTVNPSTGLTIDANGTITPASSSPGTYTITWTFTTATCPNTATVQVIILAPPAISSGPASAIGLCTDGSGSLSVTATGAGITYQWYENSLSTPLSDGTASDGTVFAGSQTNTLTITNPALTENGSTFFVVVSGTCSPAVTSSQSTLTVSS